MTAIFRYFTYFILTSSSILGAHHFATAQILSPSEEFQKLPATIEADKMQYDAKKNAVTASGDVLVIQGKRKVTADRITYDQLNDQLGAEGNVTLTEPDGTVILAKEVSLQNSLKKGSMSDSNAQFPDKSYATASQALRLDEYTTQLTNATYSACPVCEVSKEDELAQATEKKPPLWQITAKRATFDEKKQRISYRHAFFEVYGVPIAYTPYFSHATPKAPRKSGFLIPKYQNDGTLGTSVSIPYYYSIAENKDLTLTPTFTSKLGPILSGEYRHLLPSGSYKLKGSITNPDEIDGLGNTTGENDIRGHIEGLGDFDITDTWSWGFNAQRATDDTYLRKYQYNNTDTLQSRAYATYIKNRNFVEAETISFQGLQVFDDPGLTPLILPHVKTYWESAPGYKGSKFSLSSDVLSLTRDESTSVQRLSVEGGWSLPYITRNGHVFEWRNSLRADGYQIDDRIYEDNTHSDESVARFIPETQLSWSYPLVSHKENYRLFLEPIADIIISPYGGNLDEISNEDSQDVEFSDVNLFSSNHFTGIDRIEEGPRANYGLKLNVDHDTLGYTSFLLGQTYRLKDNELFGAGSGLDENQSDIVGRVAYNYEEFFDIAYQFRMDRNEFNMDRNLVHTGVNIHPVKFSLDYLSMDENFDNLLSNTNNRELIVAGTEIALNDEWSISGMGNRDIEDSAWRSARGGLIYRGKCVSYIVAVEKEFTRDRDIEPNTSISFQISLRNLTK